MICVDSFINLFDTKPFSIRFLEDLMISVADLRMHVTKTQRERTGTSGAADHILRPQEF